ncbi:hypothetical protein, partial [Streptomyces sp. NPDC002265]|uniref:hypothetical protein n=1 Tax=Streptomyces sp. NPDC002265 TaxID=3154415 RepID=UPI0033259BEF
ARRIRSQLLPDGHETPGHSHNLESPDNPVRFTFHRPGETPHTCCGGPPGAAATNTAPACATHHRWHTYADTTP